MHLSPELPPGTVARRRRSLSLDLRRRSFSFGVLGSRQGVKGGHEDRLLVAWQFVIVPSLPQAARAIVLDVIAHPGLMTSAFKVDLEQNNPLLCLLAPLC
jgi:hypothetical protein